MTKGGKLATGAREIAEFRVEALLSRAKKFLPGTDDDCTPKPQGG
jgi:hypothetical protein